MSGQQQDMGTRERMAELAKRARTSERLLWLVLVVQAASIALQVWGLVIQ